MMTLHALGRCRGCGATVNRSHAAHIDTSDSRQTRVLLSCPGCQAKGGLDVPAKDWRWIEAEYMKKRTDDGRMVAAFRSILDEQIVKVEDIFEFREEERERFV